MLLIIVHRLLQSFFFPPFNCILIAILGLLLLRFFRKTGTIIISLAVFLLYIQSIPATAYILSKKYELPPLQMADLKTADAIVILGGGVNPNGFEYESGINVNLGTLVRLQYAASLAKLQPHKLIITSGGYTGKVREANVMRDILRTSFGVKNPILVEPNSRNTDENAKFVANLLQPLHVNNVILITQAYHMRRSIMLFKKYGLNPTAGSTDYYVSEDALTPWLSFIPSAGSMLQVSVVFHEIVGYYVYK